MFRLDQHIEILLLKHDCVIIPDFGGFVVHHIPAHIDESDGMMLPPKSIVGFNQQLTLNDSLLVQSYIDAYDLSYPEAQREIEHEVGILRNMIEEYGYFDIRTIGRIKLDKRGIYEFEPSVAGILVPGYYGLTGIDTTNDTLFIGKGCDKAETPVFPDSNDDEDNFIKIPTSVIRNVAVACAIVAFILCIPFANKGTGSNEILGMLDTSFFSEIISGFSQKKEVPSEHKTYHVYVNKKAATPSAAPTEKATDKEESKTTDITIQEETTAPTYAVVLAARISQANAEAYVQKLISTRNMNDVRIIGEGKGRKVVCGHFTSEEDAHNKRRELFADEEFENAWVTQIK